MFVSINWIKEYVDLDGLDIKKLIENFTLSTAEVEDITVKGADISNVVVGEILSVENHPNSQKLHLLKVDAGSKVCNIVCGAPNVERQLTGQFRVRNAANAVSSEKSSHSISPCMYYDLWSHISSVC